MGERVKKDYKEFHLPRGNYYIGDPFALEDALKETSASYSRLNSILEKLSKSRYPTGVFEDADSGYVFFFAKLKNGAGTYLANEWVRGKRLMRMQKRGKISLQDGVVIAFSMPPKSSFTSATAHAKIKKRSKAFSKEVDVQISKEGVIFFNNFFISNEKVDE
jgi:hypothetical protein